MNELGAESFYQKAYPRIHHQLQKTKRSIAHLLGNVDPTCIAFAESTSDAFAKIATSIPIQHRAAVAIGKCSFISLRAGLSPLQQRGVQIYAVGTDDGEVLPIHLDRLPANRIAFVAVDWVNWRSGLRNRLQPLAAQCREMNIPLVVDAVQGLGAVELDFNLDEVGALVCGGHKWLSGPEGTGFVYVSPWLQRIIHPTTLGYRSVSNSIDDVSSVVAPRTDAAVLEVGTVNTLGLIGLGAAIETLKCNRYSLRSRKIVRATNAIFDGLSRLPSIEFLTPSDPARRAGIVTFRISGCRSKDVQRALHNAGLICGLRDNWIRISPGPEVNSREIIQRLSTVLKQNIKPPTQNYETNGKTILPKARHHGDRNGLDPAA
jgi:selenocysteine lyase/cysteine desulfurase